MLLTAIGAALCVIGICLLFRVWHLVDEQTKEGFQRPDIADIGELRTRLQTIENQQVASGRLMAGQDGRITSVEASVRQLMHSGQVPALEDVDWSSTQTEGLLRD